MFYFSQRKKLMQFKQLRWVKYLHDDVNKEKQHI